MIQSALYQSYHMTNPEVFYNKEDQWQVPTIESDRGAVTMQPYYTMMKLPGEHRRRVHPDAAVHAAAPRQPGVVDDRAQ